MAISEYCVLVVLSMLFVGTPIAENDVCYGDDHGGECSSAVGDNTGKLKLSRLPPQYFEKDFSNHGSQNLQIECVSQNPPVFTIKDFLTDEECEHFINIAKEEGLEESETRAGSGESARRRSVRIMDMNQDKRLSVSEMVLTLEDAYDLYLDESDILEMYNHLGLDRNKDGFLTPDELSKIAPAQLEDYVMQLAVDNPVKKSRYSKQVWLYPDSSDDAIFKKIQDRVQYLVQLPMEFIKSSDFQVVRYGVGGHYNAHHDSSQLRESLKCCTKKIRVGCRLCRFATVLFYLNDVEEGGGTAFPLANNDTYDVSKFREEHMLNLQKYCDKANIVVKPEKRKAVLWYNHQVDEKTGLLGELDEMTWHGGCPVTKGEKWIANFWIKSN